jgi:hypothetical protein
VLEYASPFLGSTIEWDVVADGGWRPSQHKSAPTVQVCSTLAASHHAQNTQLSHREHEVQTASNAKLKELDCSWQLFAKSTVGYILPEDKFRRTLCEELLHREQHFSNGQYARNVVEVVGDWPASSSRVFFSGRVSLKRDIQRAR